MNGFANITHTLYQLVKTSVKFLWTDENYIAFNIINQCIIDALALAYPNSKETFFLDTDASKNSVVAVLSQIQNGKEQILCKVNC